jgi:hypothetical protein
VIERGVTDASAATSARWLGEDALKPWQHRSWVFPRDPRFLERAGPVLDLYQRRWESRLLHSGEYAIRADEKTQIQARQRTYPTAAPAAGRPQRIEHDYDRGGALCYLAAWDVHCGRLFGRCERQTGIVPFGRLVEQIMTREPYGKAKRVFWIVDNSSTHRGHASVDRLQAEWSNLVLVHLPNHASWLNQIELVFSVIPTQGAHAERLLKPPSSRRPARRVRAPLQPDRHPIPVDLHPPPPRGADRSPRPARTPAQARRLINYELTTATTEPQRFSRWLLLRHELWLSGPVFRTPDT